MPYTIETTAADCKGFAVVDAEGETVSCHANQKDAVAHQRALYANETEATKENPTSTDVHVDTAMPRVRIKKPDLIKNSSVETLIKQHSKLHEITDEPTHSQLFIHHNIMDEAIRKGENIDCSCGKWSEPLLIDYATTELETLEKSDSPAMGSVKEMIQTGIDEGYKFADVLQMLDIGGYMMVVRPKEIVEPVDTEKSVLTRIKDLITEALNVEKATPDSFVPPAGVREEAKRALKWIEEGHAGANFTSVGRTRAAQLASGEGISRDTIARMKSFLARHGNDSQAEGYRPGEAGFPSPGRVAYAAWGGEAAKTWVDKIWRQYDLAKSYGETTAVYKADEKKFTLGPWYIPDQKDAHGEWTDSEELQSALWEYVKNGDRKIRLQHNKNVVAGEWVEAMTWPYPVTVPMTKADGTVVDVSYPTGTVFMGVQWKDWAWELVKAGKLSGYSIGGKSERVLVDLPEENVDV
jgi:hypothetical protein